ncbi:GNAT family N-acetyltransferase [Dongshaea marina]|uniref:GNAT family N-acetyltransferase n=1 Tax=Dongshaea marina TaxID=2047966 RepID=UPI000D3E834B|nr:GNAT family protein [Dongshaea marina]
MERLNEYAQPVGEELPHWQGAMAPEKKILQGKYCRLEPPDASKHASLLYSELEGAAKNWTYLPYGPFEELGDFCNWLSDDAMGEDPLFFVIFDKVTELPLGLASFMRIDKAAGSIEIGHLHFGKRLQKTRTATEAIYLMINYVFEELGYRRCEWKCDALNKPSCNAALRFGFTYEGTFRQACIYKERSRDTSWFSIVDHEWSKLQRCFSSWLDTDNFDENGQQKQSLAHMMAHVEG